MAEERNIFGDPILWDPKLDAKTGEITDGVLEGVFVGWTPFEFKPDEITYCLTVDTGNEELVAAPDWFRIRQYVAMNDDRLVEGTTKVRLEFLGKEPYGDSGQTMAKIKFYADGKKIGRPILTTAQLRQKQLGAGQPAPRAIQA